MHSDGTLLSIEIALDYGTYPWRADVVLLHMWLCVLRLICVIVSSEQDTEDSFLFGLLVHHIQ